MSKSKNVSYVISLTITLVGICVVTVALIVGVLALKAYLPNQTYTVVSKQFLPASSEIVRKGSIWFPSTAEYVYPDRWCIMVTDKSGDTEDFYVTETVYEEIAIGDTYEYTPERGDLPEAPYVKTYV